MGANSRSSIKGSFFDNEIPPDQIFDEMNIENLNHVYERIKQDAEVFQFPLLFQACRQLHAQHPNLVQLMSLSQSTSQVNCLCKVFFCINI